MSMKKVYYAVLSAWYKYKCVDQHVFRHVLLQSDLSRASIFIIT